MTNLLTTQEVADRLGITRAAVLQLLKSKRNLLPSRMATSEEMIDLLNSGRIKGVPPTGVRVIEEVDLEAVKERKVGRPSKTQASLEPR